MVEISVGFTGTSKGLTASQYNTLGCVLQDAAPYFLHHGDCVGADAAAHELAAPFSRIILHPPDDPKKRAFCSGAFASWPPAPYLLRNHDIVDATHLLIAAPRTAGEILRSGTWSTVRYARKQGKPIVLVFPDGTVKKED